MLLDIPKYLLLSILKTIQGVNYLYGINKHKIITGMKNLLPDNLFSALLPNIENLFDPPYTSVARFVPNSGEEVYF